MTETQKVFVGSSSRETLSHKVSDRIKSSLSKWWERMGPKPLEDRFVEMHRKVVDAIDDPEKKALIASHAEKWREKGRDMGMTATVIDFAVAGFLSYLSVSGFRDPMGRERFFSHAVVDRLRNSSITNPIARGYDSLLSGTQTESDRKAASIGRVLSALPAGSALLTILRGGIGHGALLAYTGAMEKGYLASVKLDNYKRSEKFEMHKKAAGNAVGSALKYAAEHPDDIRKTIEAVGREKRKNDMHREEVKIMRDAAAQEALKREYEAWKNDEIAKNKAYYDLSGTEPTHEQFLDWKKNREDSRKAAARAEGRKA